MTEENTGGARSDAGSPAPRQARKVEEAERRLVAAERDLAAAHRALQAARTGSPAPREWRGDRALAGPPRPAVKTWQGGIVRPADPEPEESDLLGYLSRCDCGQRALTRTQHQVWICPECASSSAGPEWETNAVAMRLEIPEGMTPEEYVKAITPPPSSLLTDSIHPGYHCARCGHEVGPEGHEVCST